MIETEIAPFVPYIALLAISIGFLGVVGWIFTTWLRVKNGYPLENSWGKAIYPRQTTEELERIKLLSQENAELRAERRSLKDRLGDVERIVTDSGYGLTHQIEALREPSAS